jgi:hypothetical protein
VVGLETDETMTVDVASQIILIVAARLEVC